jgi:ribosomal protein S18 acetylase RimI-like enzyme
LNRQDAKAAKNSEMEKNVWIEPLTDVEVEPMTALAREIWYAHYTALIGTAQIEYMLAQRYHPAAVREELARDGVWWDKLIVGAEMAGFASYWLVPSAGEMKLDKLYVHPRHQRSGYGGLMIARACEAARARACSRLVLAVNKGNAGAIAAYLKHGFRIAESVTRDIGGGFVMDDYLMEKPLAPSGLTGPGTAPR